MWSGNLLWWHTQWHDNNTIHKCRNWKNRYKILTAALFMLRSPLPALPLLYLATLVSMVILLSANEISQNNTWYPMRILDSDIFDGGLQCSHSIWSEDVFKKLDQKKWMVWWVASAGLYRLGGGMALGGGVNLEASKQVLRKPCLTPLWSTDPWPVHTGPSRCEHLLCVWFECWCRIGQLWIVFWLFCVEVFIIFFLSKNKTLM